ncbi:hypothetical protein QR680_006463 [Steinernema hermaphroditum]|uniref:Uncharacterized protein n=1 Tax=Steinernema hermaphroditum TaxID=289476 RepID=A0AA39HVL9_9BILA|nr:hypothetical protein QR680_006463 [Steinernema hermaphroditum]
MNFTTVLPTTRLVAGKNIFSNNPPLQISISTFNLVNIVFVLFVSSKITRNDMSRLYTLWLYSVTAPSDCIQIVISILQIYGIVDSSGNYYRDYCDFVQMTGKIFNDIAGHVYKTLCLLMLIATFMSYTFPFTSQKVFHPKRRSYLYLGGVIYVILFVLYADVQTMVTVAYTGRIDETLVTIWYLSIHALGSLTAIVVICLYAKKQSNTAGNSQVAHRRQLLSVIVYATMPNVLVILQQMANGVALAISTLPMNQAFRYASYGRVPILTLSTFVAFTSYRHKLKSMIPFRVTIVHVKASPSSSQTMSVSAPQFQTSPR